MKRREFISLLGGAAATWPLSVRAQQPAIPIFGILLVFSREAGKTFSQPIRAYMQALGYVEGRNIAFDFRFADGKVDRLPALAADLVAQRPAVIATFGDATGLAVQAATTSIPIVSMSEDLVKAKLVTNMRHPGGNTTGVSIMGTELDAKRLEILSEMLPARTPCCCWQILTTHRESRPALDATAERLGLTLRESVVGTPDPIEHALRDARQGGAAGVNVLSSRVTLCPARAYHQSRRRAGPACDVSMARNSGRGWLDCIRSEPPRCFSASDRSGRQGAAGRKTR